MIIGIVCAVEREAAPFLPLIEDLKMSEKSMLRFFQGKIKGAEVVLVTCGVCKVNAAIAAQILVDTYKVDVIINAGTAGAMDENLNILDAVIATEVTYHDVSNDILTKNHPKMDDVFFKTDEKMITAFRIVAGTIKTPGKLVFGRMVTGESFIDQDGRDTINERFAPMSVDMETAAIAHVCYVNQVPFAAVRCITDTAKQSGIEVFEDNVAAAADVARDVTVSLLDEFTRR
ncbi:MAG: 5'-methylthioadenosine/S-adenosylhomocysteine nucleosidase [Firmicutes bacterium]|nr:5'-methylthioadenosine/S-adenosylhomocysteine nucleosidase [Bacillota bacterium]